MFKLSSFIVILKLFVLCKSQQYPVLQRQQSSQQYAAIQIPAVACPNYFQYLQNGPQYLGKLTLSSTTHDIELVVYFSQRQPLQTNYYGKISLFEDRLTTINRIDNRQPISYRIDFPTTSEVPKLTRISVNGQTICSSDEYPQPSTRLLLNHKLQTKTQTLPQYNTAPGQMVLNQPQSNVNFMSYQGSSNNPLLAKVQPLSAVPQPAIGLRGATPVVSQDSQCGVESGISAFIYGGEQVMRGQYPWLTAIFLKSAGLRFLCGGTLLTQRTVITAAHCFKLGARITADRLVVNLGRHNLEDYSEQNFQTREIQNLIIHPEYNSNIFPDADLAILHMQQPVQYSNFIRPICLWSEPTDSSLIVGSAGVVAGWGADETGRTFTPVPKKVTANIVSDSVCLASSQIYSSLTSPRTFCAGNKDGSGPCMGDSGSGLIINRNGRWFIRGVVSGGQTKRQKCNLLEYVVFCDVAKHRRWVQSNML